MVQQIESWGVKIQKTASGNYDVEEDASQRQITCCQCQRVYDIKRILPPTLRRTSVKT